VVLLGISLGAIVIGCLLLTLVWNRYNFRIKPTAMIGPFSSPAAAIVGIFEKSGISTTVRL